MKIIFLGAPGAGKGTQAEKTSKRLGIPTISTGVIIREAVKNGTEMGLQAKKLIEQGKLVDDAIVNGIRMGEEFIIQDTQMGLDIAVGYAYDRCEGVDVLTAITTRRRLRVGDGQKVIKVLRDKIIFGIWRNSSRSLEVIA